MNSIFNVFDFNKMAVIPIIFLLFLCSFQGFTNEKVEKEIFQTTAQESLELTEVEIAKVLEGLKKLNRAILQASQEIPRDTFDPQAIVNNVGENPKSLFEWVRDETILVPYRGILRGPLGVLMDRCGNSLDRALLLHELLRLAGYDARLVQGSITENQAKGILENMPDVHNILQDDKTETDFENLIQIYAKKYDISGEELRKSREDLVKEKERISNIIRKRVAEQAEALSTLLKIEPEKRIEKENTSIFESLKDHWWIQVNENGDWLDLDPTILNAKPGDTLTSVQNTWDAEDLDEDLIHLLTIHIIVERWEEGSLKEETVLEHALHPSDLFGQRIELTHDPLDWPKDDDLYSNDQPIKNLKETVLNLKEWIPALTIGSDKIGKKSFTKSGEVNEKPGEKTEKQGGSVAGGLMGAFGRSKTKAEDRSILTAEWIEFEIWAPGQVPKKIRREIFDLIGPAKRKLSNNTKPEFNDNQILERNFLILGQTEILPLVCKLSPEFTEYLSAREMLTDMEVILNLIEDHATIENADIIAQMALISPLPGSLYNLAIARSNLSRFDRDTYLDRLNLFCLQTFLQQNSLGELEEFQKTDIVLNNMAVHPKSKEDPFRIRLEQGVLETNAEVEHAISESWTDNTALLFAESIKQGIPWVFIRDVQDSALQKAQIEADTRAFIEQDLLDGYVVIVPQKPIPIRGKLSTGWWRVDPRSGTTIGMNGNGSGQAMSQYARSVNMALQLKAAIQIHAGIMRCMAAAITSPLRGNRPQNDRITLRCIWVTVCSNVQRTAKGLMNIDVNWTNIIISETIHWALKSLCANLWDEGIEK